METYFVGGWQLAKMTPNKIIQTHSKFNSILIRAVENDNNKKKKT